MTSHPHRQLSAAVCNFCGTNPPAVVFDCRAFFRLVLSNDGAFHLTRYNDGWSACATCKPLVQTRSWDALATRCVNQQLTVSPVPDSMAALLRADHRDLLGRLGKHLTGHTTPFARA